MTAAAHRTDHDSRPFVGKKVVIAEDSFVQRKRIRELYESIGFTCVGESTNGEECLELVKRTQPDLVSLDVMMPIMHGVEAMGILKESGFPGVIVFVSSLGGSEVLSDVKHLGFMADAFFSKRDPKEAFIETLGHLLPVSQELGSRPPEKAEPKIA